MTPTVDNREITSRRGLPSVSVVLVVRNGDAFIREALESVFRSHLKPVEILVIDGGSTDATVQIAGRFPLTRIVPQDGRGIANAYNLGIALATGELIAFISHDDLWEVDKLDLQVDYMHQHPEVQYTVSMVQHFRQPGVSIPAGFRVELLEQPVPGFVMEALVVRKSLFDTMGLFDPSFVVGEDTDWFARVKDAGVAFEVLPQVLVRKRVHGTNSSLNEATINTRLLAAMRRSVHRKRAVAEKLP